MRIIPKLSAKVIWHGTVPCAFFVGLCGLFLGACATEEQPQTVGDYRKQYDQPLISVGAQFAALPPAVQNTVRAEAGSAEISDIVKDTSLEPRIIYRVHFENSNLFKALNIAPDGSLLDPDLVMAIGAPKDHWSVASGSAAGGTTLNDLPAAAVKAVQSHAADAQVDSVLREVSGNQITYLVTFKDRAHPPLHITADGTILADGGK